MSEQEESSSMSREDQDRLLMTVASVLFLPATIMTGISYILLTRQRNRPSVITAGMAVLSLLTIVFALVSGSFTDVQNLVSQPGEISSNWRLAIPAYLALCSVLGVAGSAFMTNWLVRKMEANPHRKQLPGNWMYKFEFRRAPWEEKARAKMVSQLKSGSLHSAESTPVGICEEGEYSIVSMYETEMANHTLISGQTGSGKTITMLSMILNDIVNGLPVVVLDMKRSPELAAKLAAWCKTNGRTFYHFVNGTPEEYDVEHSPGQATYDMLRVGTPTVKAEMILNMREFDTASEVYKQYLQQVTQVTMKMLDVANREHPALKMNAMFDMTGKRVYDTVEFSRRPIVSEQVAAEMARRAERGIKAPFNVESFLVERGFLQRKTVNRIEWNRGGLYQFATAISGDNLRSLTEACAGTEIEADAYALAEALDKRFPNKMIKDAITELQGQMRIIFASDYGRWLMTDSGGPSIDLFNATKEAGSGPVILFSLNADSEREFARFVGSLIVADITNVSARRRNLSLTNRVKVYVDEFQTLPQESVTGLLEKSRASEISVTLSQQSIEQVVSNASRNGEAFLKSILDNCGNFVIHAGMTQDTAERIANVIGSEEVETYSVTGGSHGSMPWNRNHASQKVSTKTERQWKVDPEVFMKLSLPKPYNNFKTTAVVVNKSCADPRFKARRGAVARVVHMIPDEKVLAAYYEPTSASDGDSDYAGEMDHDALIDAILEDEHEIGDIDPDLAALLDDDDEDQKLSNESYDDDEYDDDDPFSDDDESADGDFRFELIGVEDSSVEPRVEMTKRAAVSPARTGRNSVPSMGVEESDPDVVDVDDDDMMIIAEALKDDTANTASEASEGNSPSSSVPMMKFTSPAEPEVESSHEDADEEAEIILEVEDEDEEPDLSHAFDDDDEPTAARTPEPAPAAYSKAQEPVETALRTASPLTRPAPARPLRAEDFNEGDDLDDYPLTAFAEHVASSGREAPRVIGERKEDSSDSIIRVLPDFDDEY